MSPTEAAAKLQHFNDWRRGHHDDAAQPDPREIGEAIDAAIEMIERLEAAEKERDNANAAAAGVALKAQKLEEDRAIDTQRMAILVAELNGAERERDALRAALQHEADCVEAAKAEIEALRSKIEAMERQEPARLVTPTAYRWRYRGAVMWQYGELTEEVARLEKEHNHEVQSLYLATGAPTALLVAAADLVAQMEIVSRVGFVDTPNDKDSCAAFCVAEGTWLELMSAIESLASALAAAPEAKP